MAYGKLRYSKKPFENAERYQYKTLLGKTRDIYCSGEPIPESALELRFDIIYPIGFGIASIVIGAIKLRKAEVSSAYIFYILSTKLMPLTAVGGLVILIFVVYSFRRIRRYIISRRKYVRVFSIEGEDTNEKYQSL